ncbi:kinase-like protein [Plenodomus tracheiphilus IPT5]|uniref:Kinase-like protein n=1 Tax=Plenodomus tracheiphilus IPT5 TaxID=1408161 RepID=A0A6A7BEH0_9PLEO|nr:kinase-like protein [Plenodomus tracheiphilus IPT5]
MPVELKNALQDEKRKWSSTTPGRYFIPEHRIDAIMTNEAIARALLSYGMDRHELHQVNAKVVDNGRKTFAILIMIGRGDAIRTFVEKERYSPSGLDAKLPLMYPEVREHIGHDADDFDLRQWELIAPIFYGTHSCLADETILPFTYENPLKEEKQGSFGKVYEVKLPRSHIKALATAEEVLPMLIRKDIGMIASPKDDGPMNGEDRGTDEEPLNNPKTITARQILDKKLVTNFRQELKMLAHLRALRHPSILPLFGSYTFKSTHSFLFPRKACNLGEVLSGEFQPLVFKSDRSIFYALSLLSSAMESLHNFTSDTFQVDLIGCHRDIKPDNILVDDEGLYLADFGLSVFREAKDGSSTSYNHGGGHYRAPECEIPTTRFQKGKINRASDVWSFGCILAVVLTYLTNGHAGVTEFKQKRWIQLDGVFATYIFHNRERDHPHVKPWLKQLPMSTETARPELLALILEILNTDPLKRPLAKSVTLALRRVSILCRLKEVSVKVRAFCGLVNNVEIEMEYERLMLIQASISDAQTDPTLLDLRHALDAKLSTPSSIDDILRDFDALELEIGTQSKANMDPQDFGLLCVYLYGAIDRLLDAAPKSVKKGLLSRLEIKFLSTEDQETLERYRDAFSGSEDYRVLSRLAAAKLMNVSHPSSIQEQDKALQYDSSLITSAEKYDGIEVADFNGVPVVVESKKILVDRTNEYGQRLLERVIRLTEELSKPPIEGLNTLRCVGFHINLAYASFSLLFRFPEIDSDQRSLKRRIPRTLAGILAAKTKKPMLEHRFQLALNLAQSVAQFHKAAWLHKNLNSCSIVFFQPQIDSSNTESPIAEPTIDFRQPFVVGFNHSRPEDEKEWSEGPVADASLLDYQHPDYTHSNPKKRYRRVYDYYSLGMVLLEIGLWKTLKRLTKDLGKNTVPHEVSLRVIEDLVPELGVHMGSTYASVVRFCLKGIQKEPEEDSTSSAQAIHVQLMFNEMVIKPLQACIPVLGPSV